MKRIRALTRNPIFALALVVVAAVAVVLRTRSMRDTRVQSVPQLMERLRAGGMMNADAPDVLVEKGAEAIPALTAELASAPTGRAAKCAEILGRIGDASAAPALVQALATGAPPVKAAAATALGQICAPEAYGPLAAAAREGLPEACSALAAIRGVLTPEQTREAEGILLKALAPDKPAIDRAACLALAGFECEDALPVLRPRLASEGAPTWVAEACARLGDADALTKLGAYLSSEDAEQREDAAAGLVGIGKPAVPVLRQQLSAESAHARALAAQALGELRDAGAKDALLSLLQDDDAGVIAAAAESVAQMRFPEGIEALAKALPGAGEAQDAVARALGSYGAAAAATVSRLLEADDPGTVRAALTAVREGSIMEAAPAVTQLLTSSDPKVANRAAITLGVLGDKSAIPALRKAARAENPKVAAGARTALLALGAE